MKLRKTCIFIKKTPSNHTNKNKVSRSVPFPGYSQGLNQGKEKDEPKHTVTYLEFSVLPDIDFIKTEGVGHTFETTVVHEMGHSYDYDNRKHG